MLSEFNVERDLKHRIRDIRFFETTFRRNAHLMLRDKGKRPTIDQPLLRSTFLAWLENFQAKRHFAEIDRRDFICFSAGQMLAELLRHGPIAVIGADVADDESSHHWPVGSTYVSYCLGVALSVLEQEFKMPPVVSHFGNDMRLWQSFRENAVDNPDFAIPFLDLLFGQKPNWKEPTLGERRAAILARTRGALPN
jgi:hypothetical protein